jgi:osmotically-inducible protein OsmY
MRGTGQGIRASLAAALIVAAAGLAACGPTGLAVGAGATVGVAASEERGLKNAATDTAIRLEVADRLLKRSLDIYGRVSTTVVEGRVMLTGAVRSVEDRDEAGRLAWQVAGVRDVINEIQVGGRGDLADFGRDSIIAAELRARLLGDARVSHINYAIETVNGVVYLMGIAQDQAELVRVIDHARGIGGVRRVVSHVMLRNDSRRPHG